MPSSRANLLTTQPAAIVRRKAALKSRAVTPLPLAIAPTGVPDPPAPRSVHPRAASQAATDGNRAKRMASLPSAAAVGAVCFAITLALVGSVQRAGLATCLTTGATIVACESDTTAACTHAARAAGAALQTLADNALLVCVLCFILLCVVGGGAQPVRGGVRLASATHAHGFHDHHRRRACG